MVCDVLMSCSGCVVTSKPCSLSSVVKYVRTSKQTAVGAASCPAVELHSHVAGRECSVSYSVVITVLSRGVRQHGGAGVSSVLTTVLTESASTVKTDTGGITPPTGDAEAFTKFPHGITKCPDGACTSLRCTVPGLQSIL